MRAFMMSGVLAVVLAGCGSEDEGKSYDIAEGTLSGMVGGEAWTLASAATNAFLSEGEEELWVDLYGAPSTDACGIGAPSGNSLILFVPRTPGDYDLSISLNGTFVIQGTSETENLVATQGRLRVDEVTATNVKGGVTIEYDASNSLSGLFEAVVCP